MFESGNFPDDLELFSKAAHIKESDDFQNLVAILADNQIYHEGSHLDRLAWALALAQKISGERHLNSEFEPDAFFADPIHLVETLAQYSNTDSASIIATLLYSSLRTNDGKDPDPKYLDTVQQTFGAEVADIISDALDLSKIRVTQGVDHMALIADLMRDPHDERAYLIRLSEWMLYLRTLNSEAEGIHPTEDELLTTINLYVPLSEIFYLRQTKTDLGEEWLRLTNPSQYQLIKEEIQKVSVDVEDIERRIFAALSTNFTADPRGNPVSLDKLCEVEFRVKSAESINRNMLEDGLTKPNPKDFNAFRVIIDTLGECAPEADEALVVRIHEIIRRAFIPVEDGFTSYKRDNGYRSLNDHLALPEDNSKTFAIHFVSQQMFTVNEGAPRSSHAAYKFPEVADELTHRNVTVFVRNAFEHHSLFRPQSEQYPESQRYRLPLGSRTVDMLAFLNSSDPDAAFMVSNIKTERGSLFRRDNSRFDPFRKLLASSDELEFEIDPSLVHDPEHRMRIIQAVTNLEFEQYLLERHWFLTYEEAGRPDVVMLPQKQLSVACG